MVNLVRESDYRRDLTESDMGYKTDLFELYLVESENIHGVPFKMWRTRSKGLAEQCVVEVVLNDNYFRDIKNFNGTDPVQITVHNVSVHWGMSSKPVDVDDMIYCLQEAKKFAERVEQYLSRKGVLK